MINKLRFYILRALESFGYYHPKRVRLQDFRWYFYYHEIYKQIKHLKGSVVECGVGHGHSILIWGILSDIEDKGRRVFGYDSFQGYPKTNQYTTKTWKDATISRVQKAISKAGITSPILVKGFFKTTIPFWKGDIAILNVDCDLAQSYKAVLENLYPYVISGGIIALAEYKAPRWPETTKYVDSFLADKKGKMVEVPNIHRNLSRYYFIKS